MFDAVASLSSATVLSYCVVLYIASYVIERCLVAHLWSHVPPASKPSLLLEIVFGTEVVALAVSRLLMLALLVVGSCALVAAFFS